MTTGAETMTTEEITRMITRKRDELYALTYQVTATETAIRNLETEIDRRQTALFDENVGIGGLFG